MGTRKDKNEAASDILEDALSSVTRTSRRNLIILSTLCLIVSKTGINPSNLQFPFFKMENLSENYVLYGLSVFTILNLVTFLIHAIADYLRFRHKRDVYNFTVALDVNVPPPTEEQNNVNMEFEEETGYKFFSIPHSITKIIFVVKMAMDFILPAIYGVVAIIIFTLAVVF